MRLKLFIHTYLYSLLRFLPGSFGEFLRRMFYVLLGVKIGERVRIALGAVLDVHKVQIGDDCYIGEFSSISAGVTIGNRVNINTNVKIITSPGGEIEIGDDVLIAQNVVIRANDHIFSRLDIPINKQGHSNGKIVVEDDVWIAANSVITRNVVLGRGCVIGASSVVTKDVPSLHIVGGVPAKKINIRSAKFHL